MLEFRFAEDYARPCPRPVVSLPDERVIGYEALARWPMFDAVTPQNVFSFASASRRADVLDLQCIDAAVRAALDAEMPRGSLLLINTEPTFWSPTSSSST